MLPTNSRGIEQVDDRRVINGILWRFRTGSSWRDLPERLVLAQRFTIASRAGARRASGIAFLMLFQNVRPAT
ncbi:transposase [Rhizobium leguminosarum]|nr:transposase [Rhizobium leguminosarum]MBY2975427.1 transposase [Rhizobium leguminosarum]MBY2977669.1 transposase [Rhizobium leguminosarum]MBY3006219.1 transposase [Rhizobium leguminosarum]